MRFSPEPIDPFECDDGELLGLTHGQAFVLGVEWCQFRDRVDTESRPFVDVVHSMNVPRLRVLCTRRGRSFTAETAATWATVSVGAREAN
jgi:hypothetical protein